MFLFDIIEKDLRIAHLTEFFRAQDPHHLDVNRSAKSGSAPFGLAKVSAANLHEDRRYFQLFRKGSGAGRDDSPASVGRKAGFGKNDDRKFSSEEK